MVRILVALIANTFALLLIQALFSTSFILSSNFFDVLILALVLTGLNFLLKPLLRLVFGPIIVLTLGLGALAINMMIIYLLDILSGAVTIQGNLMLTLLGASFIVSLINTIIHANKKK